MPPLFVAGMQGSTRVPVLIVVGLVVVTDPVVPVGARLAALPEVPIVGVVDGAPAAAGAGAPVVGAAPVGVVLDVELSRGAAGPLGVAPAVILPDAFPVAVVPLALVAAGAFPDAMPLPTVGVPAGLPVTPATPGAAGSHGVSGVARWLV